MNRVALAPASASEVAGLATALQVGWGSLTDAFKAFDMQGQGYLTLISFSNGLVRAGYSRARAEALFRALDQMSFGRLNLRTFLSGFGVEEGVPAEGPAVEGTSCRTMSRGSSPVGAGDRNSSLNASRQSSRANTAPVTSNIGSRFKDPSLQGPAPRQLRGASQNMPSQFQPLSRDTLRSGSSSYKPVSPREAQQASTLQDKFLKPEGSPQRSEPHRATDPPQASPVIARRDDGVDASVVTASSYLDGQTRLEDRVAALHTSLETMLEDRVMSLAQGLRAEWTKLFADEQAKFSLRTAAMGQALVKECEGKLPVGVLQEARAEARAVAQQEMQGLIVCFSSMDGNVDLSERSVELRTGLARFEQRIIDRAVAEGQRQIKVLREEVAALHGRQDRLQQRIAEVEVARGSESPSGQISNEGVTRSMSMLADDIKDLARSLRDEMEEFRRECRDAWLEEAKTRDEADAATRRSVDKQFQNLRGELAHELEFQRSALQSLIRSFEDPGPSASPESVKRMVSQPAFSSSNISSLPGTRLCLPAPPVGLTAAKQEDWSWAQSVEGSSKPTTSAETLRSRQEGMSDSGSDMSTPNGSRSGRNDWVNQELRKASKSRGEFLNNSEVLGMIEVLRKEVLHVRQSSSRAGQAKQLSPRRQEPLDGPIVEEGTGSS